MMYSLRTFSSPLSETIIHYLRCWNSTFSKKDFFLFFSIKEKLRFYSTQTLNVSLCTRALFFFFFLFPAFSSLLRRNGRSLYRRVEGKNLFLPALDVQIGEKSTYTQHAQRRTTHTHTENQRQQHSRAHGGISFPAVHDCPAGSRLVIIPHQV
jgi:hypothetical protein